jgi:signal transduction histidine kinase
MNRASQGTPRLLTSRRFFAEVIVAAFAVALLLGYLILSSYQETIHGAESATQREAGILALRLDEILRGTDRTLKHVARNMPIAALSKAASSRFAPEWNREFDSRMMDFPELIGLRVFDADGDLLYANARKTISALNISDREYFSELRDNPTENLVFSDVLIARTTGEKILTIGRSLREENGTFRGVALAPFKLSYLQELFQRIDSGTDGVVSIYRSDNFKQVLRLPPKDEQINVPLPLDSPVRTALTTRTKTSTMDFASATDGVTRIYTSQRLDNYPFIVAVGVSRKDVLAGWRVRSLSVGLAVAVAMSLLIGLLVRLRRAEGDLVKSGVELEQRVQERTAELEVANEELDAANEELDASNRDLTAANKELDAANRESEAFAYSVSHDLRTPVGAVSGLTHLLRTGEEARLSDDGKRLLGMIEGNAERMIALIDGLLRLSQLGRGAIRRVPLSMEDLVHEVLRDLANSTRAEIRIDELPGCDGDSIILRQVWANLIGNALKYSKTRDPARIDVGWDKDKHAYFVRDNGVGFEMRHAGKLFGAFERLHSDPLFEGNGVGLAIVRKIIERHGGAIWAEAAIDQGATFWFTVG